MENTLRDILRPIEQSIRDQRTEIDELAAAVTRLVRAIEQDDHLRERSEIAAEKERDERHGEITDALNALRLLVLDAPEASIKAVERQIYALRQERQRAREFGIANDPAPLMPMPASREPTGQVPLTTRDDGLALTPGQQRGLLTLAARAWAVGKLPGLFALLGFGAKWAHEWWTKIQAAAGK